MFDFSLKELKDIRKALLDSKETIADKLDDLESLIEDGCDNDDTKKVLYEALYTEWSLGINTILSKLSEAIRLEEENENN